MGSAFHQLCLRYSGTLTPTAPTANRLWETFTFTNTEVASYMGLEPLLRHLHLNIMFGINRVQISTYPGVRSGYYDDNVSDIFQVWPA